MAQRLVILRFSLTWELGVPCWLLDVEESSEIRKGADSWVRNSQASTFERYQRIGIVQKLMPGVYRAEADPDPELNSQQPTRNIQWPREESEEGEWMAQRLVILCFSHIWELGVPCWLLAVEKGAGHGYGWGILEHEMARHQHLNVINGLVEQGLTAFVGDAILH